MKKIDIEIFREAAPVLGVASLAEVASQPFEKVWERANGHISWYQCRRLYDAALAYRKQLKATEIKVFTNANPQLKRAIGLATSPWNQGLKDYNEYFPLRASRYVKEGSVASMFSPAGYLTELYREARELHPKDSIYHIDTRRPDLAGLALDQENQNKVVTTLSLSNEILLRGLDDPFTLLSTYRHSGGGPYHHAFETLRQALRAYGQSFADLSEAPALAKNIDPLTVLALDAGISPAVYDILLEDLSGDEAQLKILFEKNFGTETPESWNSIERLAKYYDVPKALIENLLPVYDSGGYVNDVLTTIDANGKTVHIERVLTDPNNYSRYMEIWPDLEFPGQLRVKLALNPSYPWPRFDGLRLFWGQEETAVEIFKDLHFGFLNTSEVSVGVLHDFGNSSQNRLLAARTDSSGNGGWQITAQFNVTDLGPRGVEYLLLRLNKLVRLYKATGMSFAGIQRLSGGWSMDITKDSLARLCRVRVYQNRCGLTEDEAMVLAGAPIDNRSHELQPSQFDQLFNSPPINGQRLELDTPFILSPEVSSHTVESLKVAFQISIMELIALARLASVPVGEELNASLPVLSKLYQWVLIARAHELSVLELDVLLKSLALAPYSPSVDDPQGILIDRLYVATGWLREHGIGVPMLYLMTTNTYDTIQTPEISNLVRSLLSAMQDEAIDLVGDPLKEVLAPFMAAGLQLSSAEAARHFLIWIDQLGEVSDSRVDAFWQAIKGLRADSPLSELIVPSAAVEFCHQFAQLVLVHRQLKLSEAELALMAEYPEKVFGKLIPPVRGARLLLDDFMVLTRMHVWLASLGEHASSALTALSQGKLQIKMLAEMLVEDVDGITLAARYALLPTNVSPTYVFQSFAEIDATLQWLGVAGKLKLNASGLAQLLTLEYGVEHRYSVWEAAAAAVLSGLTTAQIQRATALADETLSTALTNYHLSTRTLLGGPSRTRDDLFRYLLIDNRVSSEVKTSKIAEAIASLQFYVTRTLSRQELPYDELLANKGEYFLNWERYNKRYSTWAAVSQLVYFPENYVDPSIRLGQTGMMDNLLRSISQSYLNSDVVESAFKGYLNSFEEVANLEIVSAYHDHIDIYQGKTYFVAKNDATPVNYYWRSVNHDDFEGGRFPANAWTDWVKIECASAPYEDLVRPVVFQNRLYLIWVDRTETATWKGDVSGGGIVKGYTYALKVAKKLFDGGWSSPVELPLNSKATTILETVKAGLYSSVDGNGDEGDLLLVYLYKKSQSDVEIPVDIVGWSISFISDITTPPAKNAIYINSIAGQLDYLTNDQSTVRRVNNQFIEAEAEFGLKIIGYPAAGGEVGSLSSGGLLHVRITSSNNTGVTLEASGNLMPDEKSEPYGKYFNKDAIIGNTLFIPTSRLLHHGGDPYDTEVVLYYVKPSGTTVWKRCYGFAAYPILVKRVTFVTLDGGDLAMYDFEPTYGPKEDVHDLNNAVPSDFSEEIIITDTTNHHFFYMSFDLVPEILPTFKEINWTGNNKNFLIGMIGSNNDTVFWSAPDGTKISHIMASSTQSFTLNWSEFADNKWQGVIACKFPGYGYTGVEVVISHIAGKQPAIRLGKGVAGAQFMEVGPYRTRLNTLFARQLVSRAETSLNAVLSLATQQLIEPKLGDGGYIQLIIPRYVEATHQKRGFRVFFSGTETGAPRYEIYRGSFADEEQTIQIFVPLWDAAKLKELYPNDATKIAVWMEGGGGSEEKQIGTLTLVSMALNSYIPSIAFPIAPGIGVLSPNTTEYMDFQGANALYFWELFYYTPMLIMLRLMQEQRFDEATHWLNYVFNPTGYVDGGGHRGRVWNIRPLLEDMSWNSEPLDSVDPDAVAQWDPMHYKVSTFMRMLDLLIMRGDAAYMQLERDTLVEAKAWYMQALDLLGEEPTLELSSAWSNPSLFEAAEATQGREHLRALSRLQPELLVNDDVKPDPKTANTLTNLFLPQENTKLAGYWRTLRQRLFNLRNNFTLDGVPLTLPLYATPADPSELLSAAVAAAQGGTPLPSNVTLSLHRFAYMLESARTQVSTLTQFGATMLSLIERQDAEALSYLLQNQAKALMFSSLRMQDKVIEEIEGDIEALKKTVEGVTERRDAYQALYDENVSDKENNAIDDRQKSVTASQVVTGFNILAAALSAAPNIGGLAFGGWNLSAGPQAAAHAAEQAVIVYSNSVEQNQLSESYRRRRQDWNILLNQAKADLAQMTEQAKVLEVRKQAAQMQKEHLKIQQEQTEAQLEYLQTKFSNQVLYSWLRGRLAAFYYQFYVQTVTRCLMAEHSWQWETGDSVTRFIKPGGWQGTSAGLLCGESLALSLAEMENAYYKWEARALEVERTVSLVDVYQKLPDDNDFIFADELNKFLDAGNGNAGDSLGGTQIVLKDGVFQASVQISALNLLNDYPSSVGDLGVQRCIKQISVTLPVVLGAYQNVQAVLSYSGTTLGKLPRGCHAIAVSNAINDSGQFQLDFNDSKYLPFEGLPIDDNGMLTLLFPNAHGAPTPARQQELLASLNDIILHVRYTIRKDK